MPSAGDPAEPHGIHPGESCGEGAGGQRRLTKAQRDIGPEARRGRAHQLDDIALSRVGEASAVFVLDVEAVVAVQAEPREHHEAVVDTLDHETGEVLWEVNLGSPVSGFPMTHAVNGRQYVAARTGYGCFLDLSPELRPSFGNNLFMFSLPKMLQYHEIAAVAHGFRSSFRDWAAEMTDHPREVIEAALAHVVQNKVEAAYARSDLFERRRRLMDDWAEYLAGGGR